MHESRLGEEWIVVGVREQEAGMATAELCRRHGIGYRLVLHLEGALWQLSDARRPEAFEDESAS